MSNRYKTYIALVRCVSNPELNCAIVSTDRDKLVEYVQRAYKGETNWTVSKILPQDSVLVLDSLIQAFDPRGN